MTVYKQDTICALATAALPAGVAIIRISGKHAWKAVETLAPKFAHATPRQAVYTSLEQSDGVTLDHALVLGFKAPHSFTGEDVVEIQCHGGRAVVQGIIDALLHQPNVRHAEAGEFTRRAFLNQKMDLTEAEGLADLIAADTEIQRKQALKQMQGALGQQFESWRNEVMGLLAQVEAAIDFPDEELEVLEDAHLQEGLTKLLANLEQSIASQAGERLRDGFKLVILGRPNAGKSTLTNILTGKETAIVSDIAGTTRDVVEAHVNIGGYPVILADTAGLRETSDAIEREGVRRASEQAKTADITLAVIDAADWPVVDATLLSHLQNERTLVILSKVDSTAVDVAGTIELCGDTHPVLALNLKDKEAVHQLVPALETLIATHYSQTGEAAQVTRSRHRAAVRDALEHLARAQRLYQNPENVAGLSLSDLLAQDLRDAAQAIGTITGRTSSEDVLDVVFSTFCIGK